MSRNCNERVPLGDTKVVHDDVVVVSTPDVDEGVVRVLRRGAMLNRKDTVLQGGTLHKLGDCICLKEVGLFAAFGWRRSAGIRHQVTTMDKGAHEHGEVNRADEF